MSNDDVLVSRLEEWASTRRIFPPTFNCQHYECCEKSFYDGCGRRLEYGKTVVMSYVGRQYEDPLVDGGQLRLVIVGIDHGKKGLKEAEFFGFKERRLEIEEYRDLTRPEEERRFRQHYGGVVRTVAAILGRRGLGCLEACWKSRCRVDGECVLLRFAQPNLVKCAAPSDQPDMNSKSTELMLNNCSEHLLEELTVFRPTLVVFHGARLRAVFDRAVRKREGWSLSPQTMGPRNHGGELVVHRLTTPVFDAHVLYLHHPSHNHLNNQWDAVVSPALELLRSSGAIPASRCRAAAESANVLGTSR
jgi:hypothetical protein